MTKARKQNFSSFNKRRAFETLGLRDLQPWNPEIVPIQPSDFFRIRCQRLDQFDLESYEESEKLIIDAICEEATQDFPKLKIWKGAAIESDTLTGNVDYAIAPNRRYFPGQFCALWKPKKMILSRV